LQGVNRGGRRHFLDQEDRKTDHAKGSRIELGATCSSPRFARNVVPDVFEYRVVPGSGEPHKWLTRATFSILQATDNWTSSLVKYGS